MNRLKIIDIRIPNLSEGNIVDNQLLAQLLSQIKTTPSKSLFPRVNITPSPINTPTISFITESASVSQTWQAGNFIFGFNLPDVLSTKKDSAEFVTEVLTDQASEYTKLSNYKNTFFVLSLKQLYDRFNGKLLELNHAGMNIGPKLVSKTDYLQFRSQLARLCNLYKYPTGEEWPFIIPATDEEFKNQIKDQTINRNPKFELVFSEYHIQSVIQFDIQTKLDKKEVLGLLPKPYGVSFEGLENFIRTVFIKIDWGKTILRFDFRFGSAKKDFGYWLISKGGRY